MKARNLLFVLVLWTLAVFTGCMSDDPMTPRGGPSSPVSAGDTGRITMQLTRDGTLGSYCVSGIITVTGTASDGGTATQFITTDCTHSVHQLVLLPGAYAVNMVVGFDCSISGGPDITDCTFDGPDTFTVAVGQTTQVPLQFTFSYNGEAPERVVFGVGGAELSLDAGDNANLLCGPGFATGQTCVVGSVCASLNGGDPACYVLCVSDLNCGSMGYRCLPVADEDQIWTIVPGNQLMHICRPPDNTGGAGGTSGTGGAGQSTGGTTGTGGTTSTGGTSGGNDCVPGASVGCACSNGLSGAQSCNASGTGYNACACTGGSGNTGCTPGACMNCTCSNGNSGAQWCASDGSGFGACDCGSSGGTGGGGNATNCTPGQSVSCMCSNGLSGTQRCNASGTGFNACECTGSPPPSGTGTVCVAGQSRGCTCTNGLSGAQSCNTSGSGYGTCSCTGSPPPSGTGTGGSTSTGGSTETVTIRYDAPGSTQPYQVVVRGYIDGYTNGWTNLCDSMAVTTVAGNVNTMSVQGMTYTCTVNGAPANQSLLVQVDVRYADSTVKYACYGDSGSSGCSSSSPCYRDYGVTRVQGNIVSVSNGADDPNGQGGCNYAASY